MKRFASAFSAVLFFGLWFPGNHGSELAAGSESRSAPAASTSQDPSISARDGILFITFRVTEVGLVHEATQFRPGKLKKRRGPLSPRPAIHYVLLSDGDESLGFGQVPDPRDTRGFEYVDDMGRLRRPPSVPDPSHVVIRVPYHPALGSIRLYSFDPHRGTGGRQAEPDVAEVSIRREKLR